MTFEELLEEHGLDAEAAAQTLAWARSRAAELLADAPEDLMDLLASGAPLPASRQAHRDLPPVPSSTADEPSAELAPSAGDDDDFDIDMDEPDEGDDETPAVDAAEEEGAAEELDLDDDDLELLDDDDLELVDDDGTPIDEDGEPDLVALADHSKEIDTSDRPADEDPAVAALIAGLDEE